MKHGKLHKLLALVLVLCMSVSLVVPAYAAGGGSASTAFGRALIQSWNSFWDKLFGSSDDADDADLTLVEDETTVSEGTQLRASTYALDEPSAQSDSTTLKYFPVTLYDYDDRINDATHQVEVDNGLGSTWNGIYFGGNDRGADVKNGESYTYSTTGGYTYNSTTVSYSNSGYSKYTDGSYYVEVNGTKYVVTDITCKRSGGGGNRSYSWTITYDGGSTTSSNSSITLYTRKASNTETTDVLNYANWNKWVGDFTSNNSNSGNRIYSGLVEPELTSNKDIVFTKTEGGIFNADTTVKDIYNNVGLPFEYNSTTKYYTFDANEFGAYFEGTPADNINLHYSETPQSQEFRGQDGRDKGWYPFNNTTDVKTASADYFFGMKATIPFTMTANGRMNANDSNSEPIVFNFAGDDDVWVFVDGVLVLDIGGVRNMLEGSIDFANNTWTIQKPTNQNGGDLGDAATPAIALSGKIFNDENGAGTLNQTRETFAATDSHELTIFYLERGAGSSNCKIQFNLPMKDTVSVTKRATQSISSDGTVSPLTAAEQAVVDNIGFGFTLTKNGEPVANTNYNLMNANGQVISTPSTDANGHFTLRNGQTARFVGEIATAGATYQVVEDAVEAKGFKLPTYTYGGTAAGGFTVSSKSYTKGSDIPSTKENLTSAAVTAKGSDEAEDSLQFVCENYFDANLPNPSSRPVDDQIVIDYGLPVVIDVLANDVYRGDTIEIENVSEGQYGTAEIKDGKITYQLTKQLTGVEVLTYTAKVTGSGNEGSTTTTESESNTAKVYIIPATSMYYEENFSNMVTFTGNWTNEGTAQTDPQEPGVVGTVGDSPYGSDAAYLNDGGDSNGSSKYVDTTNGEASFSYTFTGEGTAFFARTSANTAYMRVVVTNITDEDNPLIVKDLRRNTIYKAVDGTTDVGTLYNIPVFIDEHFDNYGTYKVEVTIMKANAALNRGSDFYLDGIRVYLPLNLDSTDENVRIAAAAYATDGEANMTVVTLREKLIGEAQLNEDDTISWNEGDNFVVFTDTNGAIKSAEEYRSNGPKEEVYLNNGQSVTFSLSDWDANSNKIYLGIKAPLGTGTVSINGYTLNINNAADCYYDISSYADITTDEDGLKIATFEITATSSLISVTNIKVTGNEQFTIVDQDDIEADVEVE